MLAGVLALFVVALVALGTLAGAAGDAARARTAADAAALAGASGGQGAAEQLAAANGGRLVEFSTVGEGAYGPSVVAVVVVGEARAAARAELAPVSTP
jgi:hypothetical protein